MARFELDASEFDRLVETIKQFPGDAEKAINEVFEADGSKLVHDEIMLLMPVSGAHWRGKAPAAKSAKSLAIDLGNLAFTVRSSKKYGYLYFPDDGTNTKRHVGNQQFFLQGGENKQSEIIDLCIGRMVSEFEK